MNSTGNIFFKFADKRIPNFLDHPAQSPADDSENEIGRPRDHGPRCES
jgi:hypothetical protein